MGEPHAARAGPVLPCKAADVLVFTYHRTRSIRARNEEVECSFGLKALLRPPRRPLGKSNLSSWSARAQTAPATRRSSPSLQRSRVTAEYRLRSGVTRLHAAI